MDPSPDSRHGNEPRLETTASLLQRARAGDEKARNDLVTRYLDVLRRWAHGRLPRGARDLLETNDLVHITLIRALEKLDDFEPRGEGAFLAYLRKILINRIRDEIRRTDRRPWGLEAPQTLVQPGPSPLEQAISAETFERYEAALDKLPAQTREAVILWLEFGYTYRQIVEAVGGTSENAIRMRVTRALVHLAEDMRELPEPDA